MAAFNDAPTTYRAFIEVMTVVASAASKPVVGDRVY